MKGVAYTRYSTDNQTYASIEAQLHGITRYCMENNIELVGVYSDEATTGTNTRRPGFIALEAGAKAHSFDAVVVYDITRGSRDVADWFNFRKDMKRLGVAVISATERLGDISNPNDFLTELLTVGIGQHSVLQTRQKILEAKHTLAEQGKFCGGKPPLGYDIANGDYVINEREAVAVRLIFDMYTAGKSYLEIMGEVEKLGVVGKRGQKIGKNSIYSILRNDNYIGVFSWNRRNMRYMHQWAGGKPTGESIEIQDKIPCIIDDQTWERAKNRMDTNTKNRTNKSRVNRTYLLSGLIYCAKCGGAYSGTTTINNKGHEYAFYKCTTKSRLHTCDSKNIAANEIEPLINYTLKEELLNANMIEHTADAIIQTYRELQGTDNDSIKSEITALKRKCQNLIAAIENGGSDIDAIHDRLAENQARLKILTAQYASAAPDITIDRSALVTELTADFTRMQNDPTALQELIKKYIVRIVVSDEEIKVYAVDCLCGKKSHPLHLIEGGLNRTGSPGWD